MNAKVTKKVYTTREAAAIIGISNEQLKSYIRSNSELVPNSKRGIGGRTSGLAWTLDNINKVIQHRNHNSRIRTSSLPIPTPSQPSTALAPVTTNQNSALVDMFNEFINIEHEEQLNENRAANRKFKFFFERMTEKDLQKFFAPMLERFKYSYVTRHVNNIQSQTLTCIKRGTLKGIKKYELTYAAFLELCKFAADNNCPLEFPQIEEI